MFLIKFFNNQFAPKNRRFSRLITDQPQNTHNIIASFLEMEDLKSTSLSNKLSHPIYNKFLMAQMLLKAVFFGEFEKVETILKKHSELLLERGTVKDYS